MTGTAGTHSLVDVQTALGRFTAATLERFRRVARRQLFQFPQRDPMELVDETAERLLDGRRSWPLGSVFDAVFYNAMRSIADEWRGDEMENPAIPMADLPLADDGESADLETLSPPAPSHEGLIAACQLADKALEYFTQDDDVQSVLYGRLTGLSAAETQAECTMTAAAYDAARKRLVRWAEAEEKNGGRR